ncbi:PLP-dependent aminotransferase family protein [Vibrio kasasachensis]|uniref:MocR-like pyridoxine biosynthesis transcription factor PdxR n=1 Tax=Vibrio kasasachensis TaxID=2910248 RepID=UPI003D10A80F
MTPRTNPHIDVGDLYLKQTKGTLQQQLFHAIRDKIVRGLWPLQGKLPSTRKLSIELRLSRNTVTAAYEQLTHEGYIESKKSSGFYVCIELPERYLPDASINSAPNKRDSTEDHNRSFAPGVPDLVLFPLKKWQRYLQNHASRPAILGNGDIQGSLELRIALANYLSSSRSVVCEPSRVIITSGAQQALSIAAMATLNQNDTLLLEYPGYVQMDKVAKLLKIRKSHIDVQPFLGLDIGKILNSHAKALYVTPSNQYPMGTTINSEQRLKLIEWASQNESWIIEDDYDSEFQFSHRPYTSMQGLAAQLGLDRHVIYIGSLSKVMFNGLRMGYMVVPQKLVERCNTIKDALGGDSPAHAQHALADFIAEGELLRHIRKMRRLYKEKHQTMVKAIEHHFGREAEIISQPGGLHVTLRWYGGVDEETLRHRALAKNLIVRSLKYYQPDGKQGRKWNGLVLGFGNTPLAELETKIAVLAHCFNHGN